MLVFGEFPLRDDTFSRVFGNRTRFPAQRGRRELLRRFMCGGPEQRRRTEVEGGRADYAGGGQKLTHVGRRAEADDGA